MVPFFVHDKKPKRFYNPHMRKIFFDTRKLDMACRERFCLSEDLMMENAASALEKKLAGKKSVLILCGGGNNGGDGYALARRIFSKNVSVVVLVCAPERSDMCLLQKRRAKNCGVKFVPLSDFDSLVEKNNFDAVVDCIFGSGFHGALPDEISALVKKINAMECFKLACDIPSGLDLIGNVCGECFRADETVTMGALKLALYSDFAKEVCGKIECAGLGLDRETFENSAPQNQGTKYFLLEESDCKYPFRKNPNVNKGNFGHVAVVAGEKIGASVIASCAALKFGAGLATLVDFKNKHSPGEKISLDENGFPSEAIVPYEIMCAKNFPEKTSAIALGMGLGRDCEISEIKRYIYENPEIPIVLDADIFYHNEILEILQKRSGQKSQTVLTPHPKEFSVLLEKCGLGNFSTGDVVKNRVELAQKFCGAFPGITLILKGAVVLIACKADSDSDCEMFFNPHGEASLAKAGSGDVLSGLVASLLAQKYSPLDAAKSASLAHALGSKKICPDFSLTPFGLIEKL